MTWGAGAPGDGNWEGSDACGGVSSDAPTIIRNEPGGPIDDTAGVPIDGSDGRSVTHGAISSTGDGH